mgnify:CR=1 FL=1|tara:strand:- start:4030 stop:9363 length:5334 start_codon:yes stop_codon:yes gene_type:complete
MSIKKLFEEGKSSFKILSSASVSEQGTKVESERYYEERLKDIERFEPALDFASASNFVKYGSAERYYVDAIQRVYNQYPYDGALSEVQNFENSSSYFDKYILENIYPRTNGYIILSADGWGSITGQITSDYGHPATPEYITITGGPHTASGGMIDKKLFKTFGKSNIYDVSKKRYSNLHLDPSQGNTVEFWLKKDSWDLTKTKKEVIFDLWNNNTSSAGQYGRFRVELSGTDNAAEGTFRLTAMSGTAGAYNVPIAATITTSSLTSWHHYAVTLNNSSANLQFQLYQDGNLIDTVTTGSSMLEVTGALKARVGALITDASGTTLTSPTIGWGKLSASVDEFRFWKSDRTTKQVGRHWWTQVNGGTNSDDANTDLGVYYKFNEGITLTSSTDSVVLDYSGRISNGVWTGYLGSQSRNVGSAIISASAATSEFKDPIVYSFHPDVVTVESDYKESGSYYDYTNNSSILNSIPQWIIDEEEMVGTGHLGRLIQVMSSYMDTAHAQISAVSGLQNTNYLSSSYKPIPFARHLLESKGLVTSEVFPDATIIEKLLARNDDFDFGRDLDEIKNLIYLNIYNNLTNIYKSKGTENSFRNLIRCYGVDDELIKIRMYTDNSSFEIRDNYRNTYTKKKAINFNHADRFSAVVYQYPETGNSESTGFISGSQAEELETNLPVTIEVDVVFPAKPPDSSEAWFETPFITSSLFGVHEANPDSDTDATFQSPDSASIQVFAVRDELESKDAYFMVSSSNESFNFSTSTDIYKELYDNSKWTLALKIYPKNYPVQSITNKTKTDQYTVELYGVSLYGDIVENEFSVSSSVSHASSVNFLKVAKRVFAGAHRTNFSGALLQRSDVKISNVRYWFSHLSNDEIKAHARDPLNFGVDFPEENAYLGINSTLSGAYVPKLSTLALNWDFSQVTGSGASSDGSAATYDASFTVVDISSGSTSNSSRYGWISEVLNKQHTGQGDMFPPNNTSVYGTEYLYTNRQQPPDTSVSSDMISIVGNTDEFFNRETRPINHFFMVEKSMYDVVSEEMLKFFGTIVDFNNIIGDPVNRYRGEYKKFRILREMFFERMENNPDLDKFLEYYKWIDNSLNNFIEQLVPAGTSFADGVQNIVESHVLERSKHKYKFPTLEMSFDDPETPLLSINELTYNWKFNHHPIPVSGVEQTGSSCQWWEERGPTNITGITSGDATVDAQRSTIRDLIVQHVTASAPTLSQADKTTYKGSTFVLRSLSKPYRFSVSRPKILKGGVNFEDAKKMDFVLNATYPHGPLSAAGAPINTLTVALVGDRSASADTTIPEIICNDVLIPNLKNKLETKVVTGRSFAGLEDYADSLKGAIALPFSIFSSSVRSGYTINFMNNFSTGANPVNLHNDSYGPINEIPMQGPFTEKYVGGHQSRHVDLNRYDTSLKTEFGGATTNNLDDQYSRPEAWRILAGGGVGTTAGAFGIVGADYGGPYPDDSRRRATKYRDEYAKRPLNVRNIQQTTGSGNPGITVIGNYTNIYEVINVGGRHINSVEFIKNEGQSLPALFISTGQRQLYSTTNINTLNAVTTGIQGNYFGRANNNLSNLSLRTPTTINQRISNYSSSNVVIANKFSAPGGPEIQSLGYLDLKSQEYSVYNALPYRNLSVRGSGSGEGSTIRVQSQISKREGLQTVLSRHCGQFGIDPSHGSVLLLTYPTTPSFHKTPRNIARRYETVSATPTLVSVYDNAHVQHMIPQSDFQYSWFTASLGTGSQNPAEYAPTNAAWVGYIPRSGLVISGSTYVSAINWPESDISVTV